ncbi:AAA family ATPase [Desulfosporosinus sp. FKB]|uniref:AAA family ATPase n=1 Tax=Desulfosporosinus sp. FKB TaxID=1969835 RepID=UPI000B4983C8|nr:AAA family ATPase [Desulfosporosinus sp. FKB]
MTKHITELNIKTYRGISNLKIKDFGEFNIFVGDNNCGKTSVLEVLKILSQPNDIGSIIKVALNRKNKIKPKDFIDTVLTIFKKEVPNEQDNKNMRDVYTLEVSCLLKNKWISLEIFSELSKEFDFSDDNLDFDSLINGTLRVTNDTVKSTNIFTLDSRTRFNVDTTEEFYNCVFMPVNVNLYNSCVTLYPEVIKTEKKDLFIQVLKIFDKDINDISIIEEMIWIHHKNKETMPLFSYGSGMQKALLMSIVLVMAKDGVLLIDEIETALHTLALQEVFSFLIKACKKMNVQLFSTTHSIEALDKLLLTSESYGNLNEIRVITLKKNEKLNKTTARVLLGYDALDDRKNYEMELRI